MAQDVWSKEDAQAWERGEFDGPRPMPAENLDAPFWLPLIAACFVGGPIVGVCVYLLFRYPVSRIRLF